MKGVMFLGALVNLISYLLRLLEERCLFCGDHILSRDLAFEDIDVCPFHIFRDGHSPWRSKVLLSKLYVYYRIDIKWACELFALIQYPWPSSKESEALPHRGALYLVRCSL
ncbi:hypothetical protein NL676_000158 [Syzygium grande]|nr:hypothetical protein NL676_000158 [Syzygium grande]